MTRPRGNPPKWNNPDRQRRFLDALRAGTSIGAACEQAGWSYNWWRTIAREAEAAEDRDERCEYSDFFDQYREAVQKGEAALFAKVRKAADDDWRAATWLLERRKSAGWAKEQEPIAISGPGGSPIQVDLRAAVREALRALPDSDVVPK